MDKEFKVTFRIPEKFRAQVKRVLDENEGLGDTALMSLFFEAYFNPKDKITIDDEGTVIENPRTEKTIDLDDKVYAVFLKTRLSSVPLSNQVNAWIWQKMENSRVWFEKNGSQRNQPQPQTPQNGNPSHGGISYMDYQQLRRDIDTPEDFAKFKENVHADSNLLDWQKDALTKKPMR